MDERQKQRWPPIQLLRGSLVIFCLGIGIIFSMAVATSPPVDIAGSSFLGIPYAAYMVVGIFFSYLVRCSDSSLIGWVAVPTVS